MSVQSIGICGIIKLNIKSANLFFDVLKKEYKIELPNDYSKITVFASSEEQIDEKVFDFNCGCPHAGFRFGTDSDNYKES